MAEAGIPNTATDLALLNVWDTWQHGVFDKMSDLLMYGRTTY